MALPALADAPARGDDAERSSKNGTTVGKVGAATVTVHYGRPKVRGRKVWGGLVPYGKVWRTGADEASTITFDKVVKVGGKPVAAGTYALFTIPGEKSWTIILNKQAKQWGAYRYDAKQDAVRVDVTPKKGKATEALTIDMKKGMLAIHWGNVVVPVKISPAS